jgi:hypothetical protein
MSRRRKAIFVTRGLQENSFSYFTAIPIHITLLEVAKLTRQEPSMKRTVLTVGAALTILTSQANAQDLSRADLFSQQPGRYQIVTSPHNVRDTFLLDTGTGRVWRLVRYTDMENEPTVWDEMPRNDQDKSFFQMVAKFGLKFKPPDPAPKPGDNKAIIPKPPQTPIPLGPQRSN